MKAVKITCLILVIIGGINWGLVGFFDYNLVDSIFGVGSMLARATYDIVGIASIILIIGMIMMPMMDKNKPMDMMNK